MDKTLELIMPSGNKIELPPTNSGSIQVGARLPAGTHTLVLEARVEEDQALFIQADAATATCTITVEDAPFREGDYNYSLPWVYDVPGYVEQITLNSNFRNDVIFLEFITYFDIIDKTKGIKSIIDISNQVQVYGHINTAKKGTYTLTYYCDYKTSKPYNKNLEDTELADTFLIHRVIEVIEPDWLIRNTPQIFHRSLITKQNINRYSDLYWELNYHADYARLGLDTSLFKCDRYLKSWIRPVGNIVRYDGEWYEIEGYTFKLNHMVEFLVGGIGRPHTGYKHYFINDVDEPNMWMAEGRLLENYKMGYAAGDYVRYVDSIFKCISTYEIKKDLLLEEDAIFPDKHLDTLWVRACKVQFASYSYKNGMRIINVDRTLETEDSGLDGEAEFRTIIRVVRPIVDAQGYLFEFDYTAASEINYRPSFLEVGQDYNVVRIYEDINEDQERLERFYEMGG
jgi:hypothetical protein